MSRIVVLVELAQLEVVQRVEESERGSEEENRCENPGGGAHAEVERQDALADDVQVAVLPRRRVGDLAPDEAEEGEAGGEDEEGVDPGDEEPADVGQRAGLAPGKETHDEVDDELGEVFEHVLAGSESAFGCVVSFGDQGK